MEETSFLLQLLLAIPFILALCFYIVAVVTTNSRFTKWPIQRLLLFCIGIILAVGSVAGPLAVRAHDDFVAHMISHLLLGMVAPLLVALSMPVTLLLRTLRVTHARMLVKVMRARPFCYLVNPFVAAFINVGSLWLLYKTPLFSLMHENVFVYVFIHIHMFMAGYFFSVSILSMEPIMQQNSYIRRMSALLLAIAFHGILAKLLYAYPLHGVSIEEAEVGALIMYYGGDVIDAMLIVLVCLQWYRTSRPKRGSVENVHS